MRLDGARVSLKAFLPLLFEQHERPIHHFHLTLLDEAQPDPCERIQVFEGTVIAENNRLNQSTFTVRKMSFGTGVERIFPLHSPVIDKIEVMKSTQVRRAKLYYLRRLKGKAARLKEERYVEPESIVTAN